MSMYRIFTTIFSRVVLNIVNIFSEFGEAGVSDKSIEDLTLLSGTQVVLRTDSIVL